MVSLYQQCGDLDGHRVTIEIMYGGERTLLYTIRSCRMDVTFNLALNMCRSLHLIISYLQRDERDSLECCNPCECPFELSSHR